MKKALSIFLCVVSVLSFAASPCFFGLSAFASSPVTWDDVGEDAIALRDSYYELWSSSGNFSQLFKSAADIPVKWLKTLADGALALSPIDDLFFTYEEAVPVVQTGEPKIQKLIDSGKISSNHPVLDSSDFSDKIEEQNSEYTPKGELGKISYRTDDTFQKWCQYANRKDFYQAYIIDNNRFVNVGGAEDLYFQLFILYDDIHYVSEFQFHLFFDVECIYDDSGTVTSVAKYPRIQCWSNIDGDISEPVDVFSSTVDCSEYKYFFLGQQSSPGSLVLKGYKTYSDFIKNTNSKSWYSSSWPDHWYYLYNSDLTQTFEWIYTSSHYCAGTYDYHVDTDCDRGLYVSPTPIDFTYRDIDTTKIPANQIITINGDTIYNYTITNPETGDSSKFGDYITNNYTYITNNYGGSESGGSSGSGVAGNVTVGGSIDVGGSVGVDINVNVPDININVNGNGGAGGSGSSIANPDDFTSADEVDLTKYYDEAVEQSTGFQKFLKDFFGFLPAELLGVILFAVAIAIVCRVFGR